MLRRSDVALLQSALLQSDVTLLLSNVALLQSDVAGLLRSVALLVGYICFLIHLSSSKTCIYI